MIIKILGSCILQVYSALLGIAFKQYEALPHHEFGLMLDIAANTVKFFRNCVSSGETYFSLPKHSFEAASRCSCYLKLTEAIIGLLFLTLKHCADENFKSEKN